MIRLFVTIVLCAPLLASCREAPAEASIPSADTGAAYTLAAVERERLIRRATNGDAEASFRLAQYYGMAGGEDRSPRNFAHDQREKRRWLSLAASQGHETARLNWAVELSSSDCAGARRIMQEEARAGSTEGHRAAARGWLDDPSFNCRR